mmetsp:Transcript_3987/g.5740  ORF Transcript_3987/g.5740 Transcript_3987/m.5740 type:complete len:88 (+) Transcript_3987:221-484(+)
MTFNQDDGSHEESMSKLKPNKNASSKRNPSSDEWSDTDSKKDSVWLPVLFFLLAVSCIVTRSRHELSKQNAILNLLAAVFCAGHRFA